MTPRPPHALGYPEFRAAVSESFVPLAVDAGRPERFRGRISSVDVERVHVSEVSATPHAIHRTPELIPAREDGFYKLGIQLSGTALLIQDRRETILRPGDVAIYATNRPYTLAFEEPYSTAVVMFPKSMLALPPSAVDQITAVRLAHAQGAGSVVAPFLRQVVQGRDVLTTPAGPRLIHTALDLVTALLVSEFDIERIPQSPRSALAGRIRDYIDEHLASHELDPARIAAAHHISVRYLHQVFSDQGITVGEWIRERRLEHCHRELVDPLFSTVSVTAVATRWGFASPSHFSRSFKARFGYSPAEARAHQAGDGNGEPRT